MITFTAYVQSGITGQSKRLEFSIEPGTPDQVLSRLATAMKDRMRGDYEVATMYGLDWVQHSKRSSKL